MQDLQFGSIELEKFLFAQQGRDSTCHLLPVINLEILSEIESNNKLPALGNWKDQHQWNAITYPRVNSWYQCMIKLTTKVTSQHPFYVFYNDLLKKGVHFNKLCAKNGSNYANNINPLISLKRFLMVPYHFVDGTEHQDVLHKSLPLYSDDRDVYLYDENGHYSKLLTTSEPDSNCIYIDYFNKFYKLNAKQLTYLNIPKDCKIKKQASKVKDGFKINFATNFYPDSLHENLMYNVGLYQLILFAMGVDTNNNVISVGHNQEKAWNSLRQEMLEDGANPWVSKHFCKKNFFEYQLAKLIQQDPNLEKEIVQSMSAMPNVYSYYKELMNLYVASDFSETGTEKLNTQALPCKSQIIAYSYSLCLRWLWASSISQRAFVSILEIPKTLIPLTKLSNFPKAKDILEAATSKNSNGISFLETWDFVKERLLSEIESKNLFSFNGHGSIVSFSPKYISLQSQTPSKHETIREKLGFAVIDSLYSNAIKPFYSANAE